MRVNVLLKDGPPNMSTNVDGAPLLQVIMLATRTITRFIAYTQSAQWLYKSNAAVAALDFTH